MEKLLEKPEKLFLIICLFWGLIFMIINPPFQASDENSHFWKIYSFSQGTLFFKKLTTDKINGIERNQIYTIAGDYLPFGVVQAGWKNIRLKTRPFEKTNLQETKEILNYSLEKENCVFNAYTVPSYTLISYLPQIIILKLMTFFNINPGIMLYILRLCSIFLYSGLIYYAIKITPTQKWLFFGLSLLPMSLYQASAVNTDSIVIGLAFIAVAYTLNLIFDEQNSKIKLKQINILLILYTLLCVCKFAYLPLIFTYLLIPDKKFENKKQKYYPFFIFLFFNMIFLVGFLFINSYLSANLSEIKANAYVIPLFLKNPLILVKAILKTTYNHFDRYINGFVALFGWQDTRIPAWAVNLELLILLIFSIFNFKEDNSTKTLDIIQKTFCFGNFIVIYLLILTVFFLHFYIDYFGNIIGISGRYFIPIAPLLFLSMQNNILKLQTNTLKICCIILINIILLVSFIRIVYRFYI